MKHIFQVNQKLSQTSDFFHSRIQKEKISNTSRPINHLTTRSHFKEESPLWTKEVKTRGTDKYSSDHSTTIGRTAKNIEDPYKLHKKISLYNHPLWLDSIKEWWNIMDPHDYSDTSFYEGFLTKEQYLDLNIRLQKSLNNDFLHSNALLSAEDDWEVDAENWSDFENKDETEHQKATKSNEIIPFTFDKFSEFLLEIGEKWTDGNIESILFLINCLFLHITKGTHLNASIFRNFDEIMPLKMQVFQELSDMAMNSSPAILEFKKWYQRNFNDLDIMKDFIVRILKKIMPEEARIQDLWITSYQDHIAESLSRSIAGMDNFLSRIQAKPVVQMPCNDKLADRRQKRYKTSIIKIKNDLVSIKKTKPKINNEKKTVKKYLNEESLLLDSCQITKKQLTLVGSPYVRNKKTNESLPVKKTNLPLNHFSTYENETERESLQMLSTSIQGSSHDFSDKSARSKSVLLDYVEKNDILAKDQISKSQSRLIPEEKRVYLKGNDPEWTSKLNFSKNDIVYHRVEKRWRTGKFNKPENVENYFKNNENYSIENRPKGKSNKADKNLSPVKHKRHSSINNYNETPKLHPIPDSKTQSSIINTDIEQLVGVKIILPNEKLTTFLPKIDKINDKKSNLDFLSQIKPKKVETVYSLEKYNHIIKGAKVQKTVFNNEIEYLYALNQTKYDFNNINQSEFLKKYNFIKNEYRSRRDELGGTISSQEWKAFIYRLEEIIKITARRRKRRLINLKNRGKNTKKCMKGQFGQKNQLWKNIFIQPENQESLKQEIYLREIDKINRSSCEERISDDSKLSNYKPNLSQTQYSHFRNQPEKLFKLPPRIRRG